MMNTFTSRGLSTSKVYLVEERPNPSTDYFIVPRLKKMNAEVVRCGFSDFPIKSELSGATVVFVRYISPAWRKFVASNRSEFIGLIFFMDDDVLDLSAAVGLPLRYRLKLLRYSCRNLGWLRQQKAELWVSTEYLMKKYSDWGPTLVLPAPIDEVNAVKRFFYHGSASHSKEIRWLRPIVEEVLERNQSFFFEIIGGRDVYRLYRDLSRVSVVHPMKWPAYQSFLSMPGRHVGLVPLFDQPFNRARSYTKYFDITQCGAVGIYTADSCYSKVVSDGKNGFLIDLKPEKWVEAIYHLLVEDDLRESMVKRIDI